MSRRSKIIVIVPVLLLLVRSLLPVAHGQILPLEWSHKGDPTSIAYRQQMTLPSPDRVFLSNLPNKYWATVLDPASVGPNRELVEIPLFRNVGLPSQQLSPSAYLLSKEQMHPPTRSLPSSPVDVLQALNSKLVYQHPKKRQDQKENDALLTGSGPPIDYTSDDDTSAHLVHSAGSNPDEYSQLPPSKAKNNSRLPAMSDGLARYLIFSNLKRARDGYICHFKLCQVGVSGKRLSTM